MPNVISDNTKNAKPYINLAPYYYEIIAECKLVLEGVSISHESAWVKHQIVDIIDIRIQGFS